MLATYCILSGEIELAVLTQCANEVDRAESVRSASIHPTDYEAVLPPARNMLRKTEE